MESHQGRVAPSSPGAPNTARPSPQPGPLGIAAMEILILMRLFFPVCAHAAFQGWQCGKWPVPLAGALRRSFLFSVMEAGVSWSQRFDFPSQ